MNIRNMKSDDWPDVRKIYREGIATGNATFETGTPDWHEWDGEHLPHSRLVAQQDKTIAGWAALSPVSGRCVYGGVAEVSVYVSALHQGQGVGKKLLLSLIVASEQNVIWMLQAGIFPENKVSIQLHKSCGFREVGYREKLGKLDGIWRDVVLLERRSTEVGME